MKLEEKKMNLFEVDEKYYLAHCISADYKLGAGIAVAFQKKFSLRNKLESKGTGIFPDCIQIGKVFNLVTKSKYYGKPTYQTLEQSLILLKDLIEVRDIKFLAMPKVGCGLDRLSWGKVREIIQDIFKDTDIEILVCSL